MGYPGSLSVEGLCFSSEFKLRIKQRMRVTYLDRDATMTLNELRHGTVGFKTGGSRRRPRTCDGRQRSRNRRPSVRKTGTENGFRNP